MDSNDDRTLLKEIQKNVLLGDIPQDIHGVKIWVSTLLSDEFDADFYEVIPHEEGVFDLILGDVMGKGGKAQVIATQIKELITKENVNISEIASVMDAVINKTLAKLSAEQIYLTLFYGRFDLNRFQFEFLDFGYTRSILLKANGDRHFLKTDYLPLGMKQEKPLRQEHVSINKGDKLVFYSDGLMEALDQDGEPLGIGGAQALVEKCKDRSCKEMVDFIFEELKRCHTSQNDITCMVVEVLAEKGEHHEERHVEIVSHSLGVEEVAEPLEVVEEASVEEEPPQSEAEPVAIVLEEEQEFTPNLEGLELLINYVGELMSDLPKNEEIQVKMATQKVGLLILQALSKEKNPSNLYLGVNKEANSITLQFFYSGKSPISESNSGLNIIRKSVNQLKLGQDQNNRHYVEIVKRF